tara:strand:- start:258 stop:536 length:279 start_codon:yes stop_codon:yes gene_type:complete
MTDIYSKVIEESDTDQIRLTINEFRGVEYLHLRRYYLDFEEVWRPTKDGISMPLEFDNIRELFIAITEILSLAESRDLLKQHFKELIDEIYQ